MKRFATLSLVVLLLFVFCSCKKTPAADPTTIPTETTVPVETTAPTVPEVDVAQQPMVAISMPVVTETETAADETVIFQHTYQNISLTLPEPEVADKVIVDFLNKTDLQTTADSMRKAAVSAHAQGSGLAAPYSCSSVYTPTRVDRGVVSLFGNCIFYEGGAHGSQVSKSISYDLITGNPLTWEAILQDNVTADQICELVLEALQEHEDKAYLFEDHTTTVKNIFAQGLQHHTDWYFTESALCCFFSPYEIGPFSIGTVAAEIPYDKLVGILKDEYFPPERDQIAGSITAQPFDAETITAFTQMTEVVVDGGGKKLVLFTDTMVYDIRIETGSMTKSGDSFIPEYTVLGAATLTPGDAIMIDIPGIDSENAIRITYTANGETQELLPTLS